MYDSRTDDELMGLGAAGDDRAFQELVRRWERPVFAFLERMVGSREEAQDLGQEAFVRMCVHAPRYRPSGQFKSWIFRIAGNLARSALRRRKVLRWVRFDPALHDRYGQSERPGRSLEQEAVRMAVRKALDRLPDRQRQALILRQFEGMSHREIAETMDTTVAAVETLLFRAMSSMRRHLGGQEGTL